MNERLVVVDGVRTPFCKAGSSLASLAADELGRVAVNALLLRTGLDPALVDEVIFGCVAQPVDSANVARVIALRAGIPQSVPAVTVHRNCASGFESFTDAYERMVAGKGSVFIVGGAESMSQVPLLFKQSTANKFAALQRSRSQMQKLGALAAFRPSDFAPRIGLKLGLSDPVSGLNMGETAEVLAREFAISREAQDAFALRSHQRAIAAREKLAQEITPVYVRGKAITEDNGPRENQSEKALAALKPVFDRKFGTVTAGNSSQITDGAVALLVMTERKAAELGYTPLGQARGLRIFRLRSSPHGARPGICGCEDPTVAGLFHGECRYHRDQRGFCRAGACGRGIDEIGGLREVGRPRPRHRRNPRRQAECQWRRDRAGTSRGRHRRAFDFIVIEGIAAEKRKAGHGVALRGRRPGRGRLAGEDVIMQNIRRETIADNICVLTFDRQGSSANIFDRDTLQELDAHIDAIWNEKPRGVVIMSAMENIFIAGADLKALGGLHDEEL